MAFAKRIVLFFAVNLLILITISVVLSVLGIGSYITPAGLDYRQLALFCMVWGFGGAFISLGLSRIMAKWMMGVQVIDPNTRDATERWLLETVQRLAKQAGVPAAPQVGYYEGADMNAFATGPTQRRSLVAVSTGLIDHMPRQQVEGVLAHEVTHIANGDMVTMTLVQGVVNAFVMFIARVIAYAISSNVRSEMRYTVQMLTTIVLEIALSFLGLIVVAWFSRRREFRADAGGAKLAGKQNMIGALQALQATLELAEHEEHKSIAAFKISGRSGGFAALFATHPPLAERIARLQAR